MVKDTAIVSRCKYCDKQYTPYFKNKKNSGYCSRFCYNRGYYIENKEKIDIRNKKWHTNNKYKMNKFGRDHRERRKTEAMNHYGGCVCQLCGVEDIEVLVLDHISGGGTKQRRGFGDGHAIYRWVYNNHYPDGFRVLCRNCNWKEYRKMLRSK